MPVVINFFCIGCMNNLDANISAKGTDFVFELFYISKVTRQAKFYYLKVDVCTVVNVNIMQFYMMQISHFYSDFYLELEYSYLARHFLYS